MKKYLANIITLFRIVCSIWLLLLPVFSIRFYVVYLFCGFTDMIDGAIARKTHSVTEFGSKLDSVADLIFVVVAFVKIAELPIASKAIRQIVNKTRSIICFVLLIRSLLYFLCCTLSLLICKTSPNTHSKHLF